MPIKNYTTSISEGKSISEIQAILAKAGASRILTEYENGYIYAVSFQVDLHGTVLSFRLPAQVDKMLVHLKAQHVPARLMTEEHARRVTWRILKDWVSAQMALIEVGQVDLQQVFLPYLQGTDGKSLYARLLENPSQMLLPEQEDQP